MSDNAATDDYNDRRRHFRRSVYRTAELMLRGAPSGVPCTVLDESYGGVQVEVPRPLDLPDEVMIKFGDMATQLVRRCWARGNRAGYQFIEIVPAERRVLDDVPPPPMQAVAGQPGFVAFNDFIHISRPLLDLPLEPVEWLYPAEQIHALLAERASQGLPLLFRPVLTVGDEQAQGSAVPGPRWV